MTWAISRLQLELDPRPVDMGFMVNIVELKHTSYLLLLFSRVSISP
jgi:hypothetical protein